MYVRALPCQTSGPGGWRLWPKVGYWVSDATATAVLQCPFPSAQRCIGWDAVNDVVLCGVGYDSATPQCGSCSAGYYASPAGCIPCGSDVDERFVETAVALALCVAVSLGAAVAVVVMIGRRARCMCKLRYAVGVAARFGVSRHDLEQ